MADWTLSIVALVLVASGVALVRAVRRWLRRRAVAMEQAQVAQDAILRRQAEAKRRRELSSIASEHRGGWNSTH